MYLDSLNSFGYVVHLPFQNSQLIKINSCLIDLERNRVKQVMPCKNLLFSWFIELPFHGPWLAQQHLLSACSASATLLTTDPV